MIDLPLKLATCMYKRLAMELGAVHALVKTLHHALVVLPLALL